MRAQTRAGSRSFGQGKKRPAVAAICMQPQRSAAQRLPMKRKTTWRRRAASGPAEASPRRPAAAPPTRRSRARPLHSSTPGWQVALSRLAAIASPADRAGQNRHAFLHPFHCTVSDPSGSPKKLCVAVGVRLSSTRYVMLVPAAKIVAPHRGEINRPKL